MASRLLIRLAVLWSVSNLVPSVHAGEPSYPRSFLGFFEPGMTLEVSHRDSGLLTMRIIGDDEILAWKTAYEKKSKDLSQRPQKVVAKEPQKFLPFAMNVWTVVHVGDDYILVLDGLHKKRAVPIRLIEGITFDCPYTLERP